MREMIKNRQEAAELLAHHLNKYRGREGVVLAIPRGGVPVAAPIAQKLGMPLEVVLSKKIGHPNNPEFAIGAVSLDTVSVDERAEVPHDYIEEQVVQIREKLRQKHRLFMGERKHVPLQGKLAILVDDGIATGRTLISTIELVKKEQPDKIIVAVPVAPESAVRHIEAMVDEMVCLLVPPFFQAVGQFYEEFTQTPDEEVIALLQNQA